MSYTIVGVIGHIDHGKTSLVAALTGIDTDTHPEEKQRGITIDLGFASFSQDDHTFALVDAPGHQKYIGNLLAGVSGVDVGLLVVAVDQGIQAQTLEHAAILQSLGVSQLIAVLSRIDLADDARKASLAEELELFLADYGFEDVPTVAVSTVTGQGLDDLRGLLVAHARQHQRTASKHFRMPVDRAFTIEGRGTVVAGTPWSGKVTVGEYLQVARNGERVRVREIESHGESVDQSQLGMRTAMNVVGATSEIARGDELVGQQTHRTTSRLIAEVKMFRDAAEIRCPTTIQLHTATTACAAKISGVKRLRGAESAVVVIDTESPIVATFAQQCLLRRPYPVGSFAGARVLGSVESVSGQTSRLIELGANLIHSDDSERIAMWVDFLGEFVVDELDLELTLGIAPDRQADAISSVLERDQIEMPVQGRLVSRARLDTIAGYIEKVMKHQAEASDDAWLDESALIQRVGTTGSAEVIRWMLTQLVDQKRLVKVNNLVAIASEDTVLSKKQLARMNQILKMFAGSRTPPTVKEIAKELQTTMDSVSSLIRFATQQRVLIDFGDGFLMDRAAFTDVCRDLNSLFQNQSERTVADVRDHLKITRKRAIPLLEYCDAVGITVRDGDKRRAGTGLVNLLAEYSGEPD